VFGLVALTAAVSASGIAYWLNREAVLTRTQDAVLRDFEQEMQNRAGALPPDPSQDELQHTAGQMANSSQRFSVVLVAEDASGKTVYGNSGALNGFTVQDVPTSLREAVNERQPVNSANKHPYHLYWQRVVIQGTPYLVAGTRVNGGGPTGYMLKSLEPEAKDLNSLAWSLGIATGLALIGSALLAQAAASTVLKPVQRLGVAARRLGEGRLDTRLRVSGTDELADLSRTFNNAAEALEKRVADMAARDEASRRFVADMSHELRTPLTAITAVTEVLEEELEAETGSMDPMIEPAVRLVVSETRRLNDLVENLMEVTRFDAGTARLVLDDVDVADQITACIDARAWLDAVELDAERGIHARLDPRRLDVILANLVGNALKHGGSPVRIAVREADDEVVIEVRDHGPGIPEDVLPHVFDRFYKASASRPRSEGSGLGLSIALENAHIHGGGITAANSGEGGAVFTLRLPRDASALMENTGEGEKGKGNA
jgi:two-component system sensor histidine kinase MtrB